MTIYVRDVELGFMKRFVRVTWGRPRWTSCSVSAAATGQMFLSVVRCHLGDCFCPPGGSPGPGGRPGPLGLRAEASVSGRHAAGGRVPSPLNLLSVWESKRSELQRDSGTLRGTPSHPSLLLVLQQVPETPGEVTSPPAVDVSQSSLSRKASGGHASSPFPSLSPCTPTTSSSSPFRGNPGGLAQADCVLLLPGNQGFQL